MAFTKKESRALEVLVRKAQKGDADAFGDLYDQLVVPIYRYIYYRVSRSEAEDLTETVFLRAWEKRRKYRKRPECSFTSWVFRIAHNVVVDFYRANAKMEKVELTDEIEGESRECDPAAAAQLGFDQKELATAVRRLPEIQQQVIVLKFINDLENAEIAEVIGKSVGSVRVIQFRALSKLKDLLVEKSKKQRNAGGLLAFKTVQDA